MARPRKFDDSTVLEQAMLRFWQRGYATTSVRDLAGKMGLTSASRYNAFGDKHSLYARALDHYVQESLGDRIERLEPLPPRVAIEQCFQEIIK